MSEILMNETGAGTVCMRNVDQHNYNWHSIKYVLNKRIEQRSVNT